MSHTPIVRQGERISSQGLLLLRLVKDGDPESGGRRRCRESLTHEELAAQIATTRDQVSAILSGFRSMGLIDYRRGSPISVDTDRLGAYLETAP